MNFKFIILTFTLFFVNTTFSQKKELHIQYDFYFQDYYPEERQISVISNHKESLSTITRTIMYKDFGTAIAEPKSWYTHFFKTKDSIIYKETTGEGNSFFVGEPLNQFKWKLTGNSKTILKYNCQEATTNYRGRDYIAYFTTKIPFKAAPWKFHGLPGVMLAVKTSDDHIKIQARTLQIKPFSQVIENPFSNINEFITWEEFENLYVKSWEKFKRKFVSQVSSVGKNSRLMGKPRIRSELRMEVIVEGNSGLINP